MAQQFFIDQDSGNFVAGPNTNSIKSPVVWRNRDSFTLELYFMRQTGIFGRPFTYQDRSTASISVGLGLLSATAIASATSFSNLPTVVTATVTVVTGGTSIASEIQKISFSPKAGGGVWAITAPNDSRSITAAVAAGVVVTTTNHGFPVGCPVIFSTFTPSGITNGQTYYVYDLQAPDRFRIAATSGGAVLSWTSSGSGTVVTPSRTSSLLNSYAEASDVQASLRALDTIGGTGVEVIGTAGDNFYISATGPRVNSDVPLMTVNVTNLLPQYGKTGAFSISVAGLQTLLDAETDDAVELVLEVEALDGSVRESYATPIKAVEDIV